MSLKQKVNYLTRSIFNQKQKKQCPFCAGINLKVIDRKYLVTTLLKCENCNLFHRHPKDDENWLKEFYQSEYDIDTHLMTKLPSDEEIKRLKAENFSDLRDYKDYINSLFKIESKIKILDYGCSWGYNVFKLRNANFDAVGYELSIPRAKFGEQKLQVEINSDEKKLQNDFDLIMSSHVIEHLSNISEFISFAKKHIVKDGIFMAFCPNGSLEYKYREPEIWHVNWGLVHPNYLSVEFAKKAFENNPYIILTGDWEFNPEDIKDWDGNSQVIGEKLDGKELLIIAKPNITLM